MNTSNEQSISAGVCTANLSSLKSHAKQGVALENEAILNAVSHCQNYGDASFVNQLRDFFADYSHKDTYTGFCHMRLVLTGAKNDNTIDSDRQNAAKPTYQVELDKMTELGSVAVWFKSLNATKEAEKPEYQGKTAEEIVEIKAATKKAKQESKALDTIVSMAGDDPAIKAMLEYKAKFDELAKASGINVASDKHNATLVHMTKAIMASISVLKAG